MTTPVRRDPVRTRETILEAAADLFAERGYDATTLQQVAGRAGVARGTPHYFFGSKQSLFEAVLERESQQAYRVIAEAKEISAGDGALPAEALLNLVADRYWRFLEQNGRFLRLLHWTALQTPDSLDRAQSHWHTVVGAFDLIRRLLPSVSQEGARQLTLSILGLYTFHHFFGRMAAPPLGIDPESEDFSLARERHLKAVLDRLFRHPIE